VCLFPLCALVDAKGVIRHKYRGSPDGKILDEVVDALVKETEEAVK